MMFGRSGVFKTFLTGSFQLTMDLTGLSCIINHGKEDFSASNLTNELKYFLLEAIKVSKHL